MRSLPVAPGLAVLLLCLAAAPAVGAQEPAPEPEPEPASEPASEPEPEAIPVDDGEVVDTPPPESEVPAPATPPEVPPELPPDVAPEATPEPMPDPEPVADEPPEMPRWRAKQLERERLQREQREQREQRRAEQAERFERHLGLGVSLLKEHGFGGVVRFQWAWIGAEASVSLSPYLFVIAGACNEIVLDATWRVSLSALGMFGSGRLRHGPRLGVTRDGLFNFGGQLGYQAEFAFTPWLAMTGGAGFLIFPLGADAAEKRIAGLCGSNVNVELDILQTIVQPYIGVSLLFYTF